MSKQIAIDGPGGAGKSSVARAVAKRLKFIYIDTGALYRGIALYCFENNIDVDDVPAVKSAMENLIVEIKLRDDEQFIFLNGNDISKKIRRSEISMLASKISGISDVRMFLLDLQRNFAYNNNVIMDGRDIGTVILPQADVKIFLTATLRERARRRFEELAEKGESVSYDEVLSDLEKRDCADTHREISPLKQAENAVLLDTTAMSLDNVVDKIINIINNN